VIDKMASDILLIDKLTILVAKAVVELLPQGNQLELHGEDLTRSFLREEIEEVLENIEDAR
tara:strand:- start:1323 stop:1505 length:183 start_codon:yes stop_codon:yes gene_type:complete